MLWRTAIALIALAAPVFAQHGGHGGYAGHGGSFGSRGLAGRTGFSGSPGFSRSFASPAPAVRYGSPLVRYGGNMLSSRGRAGFRGSAPPRYSGFRVPYNADFRNPYNGNRFSAGRAPYNRTGADRSGNRDRGRFDRRRRSFNNWYVYNDPIWLGYPYVIDPGFYDWDDSDSGDSEPSSAYGQGGSGYDASGYDQGGPGYDQGESSPAYPPPYPNEGYRPSYQPTASPAAVAASLPEQPLTVIFKDGRAPVRIENYMMSATVLTDLDAQHYEQIPLDQVDVVATQWVNSAAGVSFQVPSAASD